LRLNTKGLRKDSTGIVGRTHARKTMPSRRRKQGLRTLGFLEILSRYDAQEVTDNGITSSKKSFVLVGDTLMAYLPCSGNKQRLRTDPACPRATSGAESFVNLDKQSLLDNDCEATIRALNPAANC
jgi:hypothetical protein